ncbi:MAG: hypothetical protein JW730_11675 [Anaerolineales bacterium]|nr:hypothetical protein [Anaerolineales bacterium]
MQSVDVFIFLVGAFSSFYIDLIGQLYISEIVLILLFPFQLLRRWKVLLKDQLTRKILFFGSLWFVSQVFTDLIRDTSTNDMLRGWAGILVLLVTCSSLYLLTKKNVQRIQFLIFGYAVGALAALYFQPPLYFSEEPWKFGLGYPITLLVLLFISYTSGAKLRNLSKWMLPLLIIGGLFIYLNARSLGAMIILTAIVIWLRNRKFGKVILTHLGVRNALAGGLLLGLTIWGLISIYGYAAQNGYLGDEAQWKYVRQSSGRFGLLLGGRSEIFASVIAVRDSPVIGYGSWAKGPAYRMFLYRVIDLGYERSQEEMSRYINQSDLIPAHSHVFQSWIWAGILGAIFWLVIFGIVIQVLIQSNRYINILYTFVIFMSVCSIWDIFFSPFGSVMRLRWAIQFIVFLAAMSYAAQVQAGPERRQEPGTRQS